ncbi:MAG: T9SS type A sorting domain-containing protein, partial [Cytophagales bacterium]|nr:T9SS type A sorting domain-containing protein [Cytophagales bacterium]
NWTAQTITGVNLNNVRMVSPQVGWAVGEKSTVLKTVDGGSTWSKQTARIADNLVDVLFLDENIGKALGEGGTFISTTNGGVNWDKADLGSAGWMAMAFVNSLTGWVVGKNGKVSKTSDGVMFTPQVSNTNSDLKGIYFLTDTQGWIVGDHGTLLSTTNAGQNWSLNPNPTTDNLKKVQFISPETGWIAGSDGIFMNTTNSGLTWTPIVLPLTGTITGIYHANESKGWVITSAGDFIQTTDGWKNWTITNTGVAMNGISFVGTTTGWISGFNSIFKYQRGAVILADFNSTSDKNEALFQVFPNPTTGFVTIQSNEAREYKIMDGVGAVIKQGTLSNGKTMVELGMSQGIYYLSSGGAVKKLVLE